MKRHKCLPGGNGVIKDPSGHMFAVQINFSFVTSALTSAHVAQLKKVYL